MKNNVEVLVNGKPVKIIAHQGKLFIQANEGSEYTVKIKNDTYSRVMAVASVDGINVVTGKIAEDTGTGYVMSGKSSYEIKGWRIDDDTVNAFIFSKKNKSYAAKSEETEGSTKDCGVIGVKFFAEKEQPKPKVEYIFRDRYIDRPYPVYPRPRRTPSPFYPFDGDYWLGDTGWDSTSVTCNSAGGAQGATFSGGGSMTRSMNMTASTGSTAKGRAGGCSANFMQVVNDSFEPSGEFDLGTEFSDKEVSDKVGRTTFETGNVIEFVEIFYASRAQLEAMGVPLTKETTVAFPSSFKPNGFCKKPKK